MAGRCVEKLPHRTDKCQSADGLQVFLEDDGSYTGYCFSCGTHVANPYGDKPVGYKPVIKIKTEEEIKRDVEALADYPVVDLSDRKLKKEYLDYFGVKVGVSEEDGVTPNSVFFPFTKAGELKGYKCRTLDPKKFWAVGTIKNVEMFGWEQAKIQGGKKLFITEGEFDAVALFQIMKEHNKGTEWAALNPAVVSLSNGATGAVKQLSQMLSEIRKQFKEIVLVFDTDGPGKKAAEDVLRIIPDALVAELPAKDANECLKQGRSKAAYNACQFQASKPKNTRIVRVGEVIEAARTPPEWGFSYPFKELTDLTRGQRFGETVYWGAGVKMGKSELLNALVAHNIIEHGWKVFVIKPEESNARTLQGVVGKIENKIFHDPKIEFDYDAFDRGTKKLDDKLFMLNLYQELTWSGLEADIRAAAAEGCKAIFIDPITVLTNGVPSAEANTLLQKFAQTLAQMALDLQIVVHIFCHLKSPEVGLSHERGGAVMSHQFAGSRAMMRACHAMVGMQGNKDPDLPLEERNIRTLVLLEDRTTGSSGKVRLYYDAVTGAFNELPSK